jgi:hypothetical protein
MTVHALPAQTPAAVQEFEGIPVADVQIVISGKSAIEATNTPAVHMDDLIRAVGEFRVVGINHKVNSAGELVRIVTLGPVRELQVVPWDPRNPNDDGIVRARP